MFKTALEVNPGDVLVFPKAGRVKVTAVGGDGYSVWLFVNGGSARVKKNLLLEVA
jgi:hypothetical protein